MYYDLTRSAKRPFSPLGIQTNAKQKKRQNTNWTKCKNPKYKQSKIQYIWCSNKNQCVKGGGLLYNAFGLFMFGIFCTLKLFQTRTFLWTKKLFQTKSVLGTKKFLWAKKIFRLKIFWSNKFFWT